MLPVEQLVSDFLIHSSIVSVFFFAILSLLEEDLFSTRNFHQCKLELYKQDDTNLKHKRLTFLTLLGF